MHGYLKRVSLFVCFRSPIAPSDDVSKVSSEEICRADNTLYLDPSKMQKKFKAAFDAAMTKIRLPEHFKHGGANGPNFSGIRRHGPATMVMLIYRKDCDEVKINVDATLGRKHFYRRVQVYNIAQVKL